LAAYCLANAIEIRHVISFELVQIGVGRWVTQCPTHGNDLALVMKGVGHEMVEDECRSADGDVSIWEMKFRVAVKLLIRQTRQIRVSPPDDFSLEEPRVQNRRTFGAVAVDVPEPL
jgi:hypothetical protein